VLVDTRIQRALIIDTIGATRQEEIGNPKYNKKQAEQNASKEQSLPYYHCYWNPDSQNVGDGCIEYGRPREWLLALRRHMADQWAFKWNGACPPV